ncbi:MAG TPA: YciI family protein [Phenylobacterium sp.]|uniref:YciI family protein n=1 Tax=Phenylobacterium sp. TaxID=1871053 RepID=UPI002B4A339B|nr:YciI family protein [Phenylobacterium sp.]HKR88354.1 YciI family protein [Phenylobacterium sp.]
MPLFILIATDKPNALELRVATRQAHIDYVRDSGLVKIAGPLLDDAGGMAGSMLLIEAEDLAAAQAFAAADPYALAGLFEKVELRPFKLTLGGL